ncbi:hypothetical protein XENORESO_004446, partial [Xenotaenia resolanae]
MPEPTKKDEMPNGQPEESVAPDSNGAPTLPEISLEVAPPPESVAEGKEPVETDGKKPEPTGPEPLQAVVGQEQNLVKNVSSQPEPSGVGLNEQVAPSNPVVKEEGSGSPPPPVWSLGEGQGPEDVDKPIDNPPLSTLLIESPQSGTVTV